MGDEGEIVELLELVFDGWPHLDLNLTPLEYWSWKYKDNPLQLILIMLGIIDNRIIGCEHLIPLRIKINDKVVFSTTDVDVAVHPDFRGIGVSRKISDLSDASKKEAGIKFAYAITGNPILIKSLSKRYPRFPHPIINLVKIQDIDKQLQNIPVENPWLMKLAFRTAKLFNDIKNTRKISESEIHRFHISKIDSFDERIDEFWKKVANDYNFMVERSQIYLNWRYCDPRAGDFVVNLVEDDEYRILGYSVLRINKYLKKYPVGYIVDLLTLPNYLDAANALAADALSYFENNDVNLVNYQVVKGHPYEHVLKKHGFLDSKIKLHLFYNPFGSGDAFKKLKEIPAARIFVSWGDHDVLPIKIPSTRMG